MNSQPRKIITLRVLIDTLSNASPDVLIELIRIYSSEYEIADGTFEHYKFTAPTEEAREVWQDFQNALHNMSGLERSRLRMECRAYLSGKALIFYDESSEYPPKK